MVFEPISILTAIGFLFQCFKSGWDMFKQIRASQKLRRRLNERRALAHNLEYTLQDAGPLIQSKYEDQQRQAGKLFERGDEIGREQLKDQVIRLQSAVMSVFETALSNPNGMFNLDVADLLATTIGVRNGSTRALTDQYQRLQQSLPIQRNRLSVFAAREERNRTNTRRGRERVCVDDLLPESEFLTIPRAIRDWDPESAQVHRSRVRSRSREREGLFHATSIGPNDIWPGRVPAWIRRNGEVIIEPGDRRRSRSRGRGRSSSRERIRVFLDDRNARNVNINMNFGNGSFNWNR